MESHAAANLRWASQDLQCLFANLKDLQVCPICQTTSQAWFRTMSQKTVAEDEFPQMAEKLFEYVYYPKRLRSDAICCDADNKAYQTACERFRHAHPESSLSPLLSFVATIPEFEGNIALPVTLLRRTEQEKLCAISHVFALFYLNSTRLVLSLLPETPDEGDLIRVHQPELFARVQSHTQNADAETLMQMQEIACLRFLMIMACFERVRDQKEMGVENLGATLAAGTISIVSSVATTVLTGPIGGALMVIPSYNAAKSSIQLVRGDYSQTDPHLVQFSAFTPELPMLTYGFNPTSSSLPGKIKGTFYDNPSRKYGFVRLQFDQMYYYPFNVKNPEPIASSNAYKLAEKLREGIIKRWITLEQVRAILHTLRTFTLPKKSEEPANKLISHKTGVYLTSILIDRLQVAIKEGLSAESAKRETLAVRKIVETDIRANLMTVCPETIKYLETMV